MSAPETPRPDRDSELVLEAPAPVQEAEASAAQAKANVGAPEEGPERLPMNTWVTLGLFAAFVVAFGTCASSFMFK